MKNTKSSISGNVGYEFVFQGYPLDLCKAEYLSSNAIKDMHSIFCYDYEGGKPWHDNTVVMEINFYNYHDDIGDNKIRIMYSGVYNLMCDFFELTKDCIWDLVSIKMDLSCNIMCSDRKNEMVNMNDFEKFDCHIKHKVNPVNPVMPND